MMEKTKIGVNAGKVWRILNEKGELSMFDCMKVGVHSIIYTVENLIRWMNGIYCVLIFIAS